jgi:hypothetical protein
MEHPDLRGLTGWKPLARGGISFVWQASQLSLDRLVAVKVYQSVPSEGHRRRLPREAAIAGTLSSHPGVVTTHDAGLLPDDRPYLIMELCPGGSLTRWLKAEHRPSEEQVRQVGVRMADALAGVHACGVVHRDVKPGNILIDAFGNPRLADFGVARWIGVEAVSYEALRVTPAYAPPEVFQLQPATEAGDVFSLAATLYALLAGHPPRSVGTAVGLEQLAEVATRPIAPVQGVDVRLMDVLMTALSNESAERPPATEFRDRLENLPASRTWKRGPLLLAGGDPFSLRPRTRVPALMHSATSFDDSIPAVATATDAAPRLEHSKHASAASQRGNSRLGILAVVTALIVAMASVTAWRIGQPTASGAPAAVTQAAASGSSAGAGESGGTDRGAVTSTADNNTSSATRNRRTIQMADSTVSAKPFQTVRIRGRYDGGADSLVRVERWQSGKWLAFPIPAKTDQAGEFSAYVDLGQPSRYRLRVQDVASGVKSEPFVLVVKE